MLKTLRLIIAILGMAITADAHAHRFWIEAERFTVPAGTEIAASLRVGDHFSGVPFPYLSDRFISFSITDPTGTRDVEGNEGDDPAILFKPQHEGLISVSYYSTGDIATFDNNWELFLAYLEEEGLENVAELHKSRDLPTDLFSETYFRCAKGLMQVGSAQAAHIDSHTGMPFEWVAQENPYAKGPGGTVRLQLLWQGHAYKNALVFVQRKLNGLHQTVFRTDENGTIVVPLERGGLFLANAVHMRPAPAGSGSAWESHWASLTFEIQPEGVHGGDDK